MAAGGVQRKGVDGKEVPDGVELTLVSPDGDMGFPGTLTAHVRYTVEGKSLKIQYSATTTKPTVVNLTNHSFFNLAGNGKGTILDEVLMIPQDRVYACGRDADSDGGAGASGGNAV